VAGANICYNLGTPFLAVVKLLDARNPTLYGAESAVGHLCRGSELIQGAEFGRDRYPNPTYLCPSDPGSNAGGKLDPAKVMVAEAELMSSKTLERGSPTLRVAWAPAGGSAPFVRTETKGRYAGDTYGFENANGFFPRNLRLRIL